MNCPRCGSTSRIGDNYGESCINCGQPLAGYGYNGQQNACIHTWYGEKHMKYKTCIWCEQTALNEKWDLTEATTIRHCDCCKDDTKQKVVLYNPDHPEDGHAWQCMDCQELTDLVAE